MSRHIDYYFSLVSPWSYLGHKEFIALAGKHDLAVHYKPVTLPELFPQSGGLLLAKRHRSRQNYRMLELQRWREKRQLPMRLHPKFWPFDTTLADRVVIALTAAAQPVEDFLPRAFAAIFGEDRDLGDEAVLDALLTESGFDAAATLQHARSEAIASIHAANLKEALEAGVFGAPSYVLDGEVFWGQDRIGFLGTAIASGRQAFRADV
ncbi:MAG: 2-hydroxychromene-2-carboxylate isomerase [Beijerinckiaceae bacterium]